MINSFNKLNEVIIIFYKMRKNIYFSAEKKCNQELSTNAKSRRNQQNTNRHNRLSFG